jgi:hypothetical protein
VIDVRYERPIVDKGFDAPLVRPICLGEISEQLAVQAAEESAVKVDVSGAKEIDAVDLPPLPAQAARILWAFRLDAPTTPAGAKTALVLNTDVHESYEIPSALAVSARLTTYLDVDGGQRTEAQFSVANVGRQFLTIRLPQRAELWSLSVSGRQVKPQRSAAGDYEVSLGQLGRPVPVKVVYACRPAQADLERIELGRIELPGVQINQTGWTIIPPPGYRVTTQQTKMQTHDLAQEAPAYLKLYRLFTENVFAGRLLRMPSLHKVPRYYIRVLSTPESEEFPTVQKAPDKPVEAEEYDAVRVQPPPSDQPAKAKAEQVTQKALGIRLLVEGRFTLPVDLVPTAGAGLPAAFTGLGTAELTIGLTKTAWMSSCWAVGFALIAAVGIALVRRCGRSKAALIVAVLALASLLAVWRPATVHFANGAFTAALCLIPFYVLTALVRLLWPKLHLNGSVSPASAIVGALLVSVLCLSCSAHAAAPAPPAPPDPPKAPLGPAPVKEQQPVLQQVARPAQPPDTQGSSPVIIPYDGDPTAPEDSNKVLISYARFIELWNLAHPNDVIDGPRPGTDVSLADVRYTVTVEAEQLNLLLTADVRTYGRDWVVLPMPLAGLAVTQAMFAGKPAQLHSTPQTQDKQSAPGDMVLMLPGRASGQLLIKALAKPEYFGRRGSAKLSLPPLPGAVMDVLLPQDDLELEVDQIESIPSPRKTNGAVKWIVPLGMTKELTLRWLPKAGGGAADRTLSAAAAHDVYAFHWAIVGVSKITYSFSAGEHDRFALLVPKGATLTEVKGTNIRDYRDLGQRTVDDAQFSLVEVRLHRPAKKQYDLTVRWLGDLPTSDTSSRLLLVRADDVSRESGTVTLHSAGGMALKVAQVTGGRRTDIPAAQTSTDADLTADKATPVAAYYWPYRPFALSVQLSRLAVSPKVCLDQLVRVSSDATELLVQAKLTADQAKSAAPSAGKLFGASFTLPAGYELLSVVGPAVEGFYERSSDAGRFLHVKFDRGQQETKIALVLVRKDVRLEAFDVPLVAYIDSGGSSSQAPVASQQGRLAVQVAASLDAKTVDSKSLKAIVPATLKDWLDSNQINAVQFAYSYEQANPSLRLDIRPQPTRVRVEVFAGLTVKTTAAVYTYRLRYNVAGSPIDNLTFSLPDEYASLVAVNSPALRSVTQTASADGWTSWKVILVNEVTGDVDIAVNFALPIDASTKLLSVPRIRTDAPAGYRAVIAVQNMSRHDISVTDSTKLTELAASEQQKLMSPQMTESLQYVFQSFEDNWSFGLGFTPAKAAARIQAVVDLLALTTVIDRNGRCRYEARLSLQNRSEQFLQVEVPQGLRLWSAAVASQPVKPVTPADSAPGRVLIPLVKTSPGGLPYDVCLYFADEQGESLIEPLNGIARLKPPAISIANVPVIPVMRTTWSLLLPAGYRYMRPGGNMSPVAGTVEILSLDIDARLDQLKRLEKTYRDVAGSAGRSEVVAQQNWSLFNQKLNADIQQAQSFLEANRGRVADEDYRRLSSKLGGQKQSQDVLFGDNTSYIQQQQEQTRYDLNVFLNDDAVNVGVSEVVRNNALLQKPDFIGQGEQQQIARLTKELEVSQKQLTALQQQADKASTEGVVALDAEAGKKPAIVDFGKVADDLLLARSDEKAEVGKLLGDLSQQSAAQIDRKQAQIRNQLDQLKDNRSQRYFQGPEQMAQTREPMDQSQPQAPAQQQAGRSRRMGTAGADSDKTSGLYSYYSGVPVLPRAGDVAQQGERGKAQMEAQVIDTGFGMAVAGGAFRPAEPQPPQGAAPGLGVAGGPTAAAENLDQYQYVAKGTYSLPVALPEGEVRLDFARSAGQAQLSIWAVPLATIRNLQATAAVVVALLIVLGIIKIWPATAAPISAKRAIIYLALFLTLTLTLGLLGLILTLLTIFAVEAVRAASLRKTAVL